jgi:hypothetical protein
LSLVVRMSLVAALLPLLGGCFKDKRADDGGGVNVQLGGNGVSIGGTVSGLSGSLTLRNNESDLLVVHGNGPFTFRKEVARDSTFRVSVAVQPVAQMCVVAAGSGIATSAVTQVRVTCVSRSASSPPPDMGESAYSIQGPDDQPFAVMPSVRRADRLQLSWNAVPDTTHYQVLEDPAGDAALQPVGATLAAGDTTVEVSVPLHQRVNARYAIQACRNWQCVQSSVVTVGTALSAAGTPRSRTASVALAADGTTLGIAENGGDPCSAGGTEAGAVHVFTKSADRWWQQAVLRAPHPGIADGFGHALMLSPDGQVLIVEAAQVATSTMHIYARAGEQWVAQAAVSLPFASCERERSGVH